MSPSKGPPRRRETGVPTATGRPTRRELLSGVGVLLTGVAGCLETGPSDTGTSASPKETPRNESTETTPPPTNETPDENTPPTHETTTTGTEIEDGTLAVDGLQVGDYLVYPLSGTHPHVHRREDTQYVIVWTATSFPAETVQDRLSLDLDGSGMPLANRQPVPWSRDTTDVAFAVPKDESFEGGRVRFDGTTLHSLEPAKIDRLNHPPLFEVGIPTVTPETLQAGEQARATVKFPLANEGEGTGTFGASFTGNFLSGSNTLTATLDPDAQREVSGQVRVHGEGDEATVRLDWGSNEWIGTIPVVGTTTPE
ncbi:MAG: hypothetical protein ACI9PP_000297 [Halobacteriales archaeon]|jgi:hypothetical protein